MKRNSCRVKNVNNQVFQEKVADLASKGLIAHPKNVTGVLTSQIDPMSR